MSKVRLGVFVSGIGSNARNIVEYFRGHILVEVGFILTNRSDCGVIDWCSKMGIETIVLDNDKVKDGGLLIDLCSSRSIDYIILAGYLRKVPDSLIIEWSNRIINIHPSLLPKFGGKGMYGMNVHRAVKDSGDLVTGITIHYVNGEYDDGMYIAQFYVGVLEGDSDELICGKVRELEMNYYPVVIERTVLNY
jgi:phosphoribosylglycinamide formyltransferase-1